MADFDLDLFVIGGGSGGVRAARIAAGYGAKVMVAEEYRLGGTCVIRGCVPKKLLVYASHVHHEIEDAAGYGWTIPSATFDWPTLIANKDKEIARLEAAYTSNLDKSGARIARARAVFEDPHTLRLSTGETVRARHILIATGAAPSHGDPIPGIEHVISSNEVFHLPTLPRRILIQGGGYIALEFACIFAGLGSEVTVVYRGDNILRGFDDDVRKHVRTEMEKAGIRILTGCTVSRVDREGEAQGTSYASTLSDGTRVASDQVMFAIGRHPNVAGLGLEAAGVALNPKNGGIAVDGYSQTSMPHIYAVGDVTHRVNLTPVAIREGHAFADTVFGKRPVRVDHADIPTAVFTQPEVGTVGLTEAEARAKHSHVDIYKADFRPMKATLSGRDTRVLMKLVVDGLSDRVLGCHIVGPDAGEMIQLVGVAVKLKATKADFDATIAVHPTAAEELVTMRTPFARHVRQAAE
ncbi:glutathione-disulfide reductase [Bradyrhizobium sp. U87765 SZCCT0131]|uniref:glutathione-disulfide reductase n=1 Tax=unclassified Bradyrhizobium TaxID=2631580 RepID=UPI001BA87C9F|nr:MULTISPECIES: glutathione-disulfide reductase [unclassified Bradyrhizobium]MBR1221446.1 glutathione-disulfide reductase [Bradyrhizobium sp. U87765 SZCCT0131]MBR1264631.1 glutathione-disulfide reductase [Bradyrhizobium sp. U87765 SZCCT0134]MBR1304463.1 glutathione-disulfide reductase [Bradyrhizobium sp. U87765 SZCCT0110]MBR1322680.1 glutathione-disulfide reductase [Bradyrhizobium sp. U87765 SZCCT0109]MBR1346392.1 glutathione-disulfide reductase [Bradyrhizobium sp. U87765 SZCCT0048]